MNKYLIKMALSMKPVAYATKKLKTVVQDATGTGKRAMKASNATSFSQASERGAQALQERASKIKASLHPTMYENNSKLGNAETASFKANGQKEYAQRKAQRANAVNDKAKKGARTALKTGAGIAGIAAAGAVPGYKAGTSKKDK